MHQSTLPKQQNCSQNLKIESESKKMCTEGAYLMHGMHKICIKAPFPKQDNCSQNLKIESESE